MVTVIAKIKVVPGKESEFERAARDMVAHVRANEPGTRTYILHRAAGNPAEFLFYERYDDEAAFAAHGGSDAMLPVTPKNRRIASLPPWAANAASSSYRS